MKGLQSKKSFHPHVDLIRRRNRAGENDLYSLYNLHSFLPSLKTLVLITAQPMIFGQVLIGRPLTSVFLTPSLKITPLRGGFIKARNVFKITGNDILRKCILP